MTTSRLVIAVALAALLGAIGWGVYDYLRHPPAQPAAGAGLIAEESAQVSLAATGVAREAARLSAGAELPEPATQQGRGGAQPAPPAPPIAPIAPIAPAAPVDLAVWAGLTAAIFAPLALGAWQLWRQASRVRYE